jgi:hypothetical protein
MTSYSHYTFYKSPLKGFNPRVATFAMIPAVVTQHTTTCCSAQVVGIKLTETQLHEFYSIRVVQKKH